MSRETNGKGESLKDTPLGGGVREVHEGDKRDPPAAAPAGDIQAAADHAILLVSEVLALLFALPFGDALYHHRPISGWDIVYLSALAPLRNTSVSGSANVPGWQSWKTLLSVTAYHSFGGEVGASNTPTIRRLNPLCRHQLSRIALSNVGLTLYTALQQAFVSDRTQRTILGAKAAKLSTNYNTIMGQVAVPPCLIIVFAKTTGSDIARLINMIARGQGCSSEERPEPPTPPLPIDAAAPPPSPIVPPDHINVHYPSPSDALTLLSTYPTFRARNDPEIDSEGSSQIDQLADQLVVALRTCDAAAQRHRKIADNPEKSPGRWTIYIDLGTVQSCR